MAPYRPVFRVFISSTFSDFVNERAALHGEGGVVAELRQYCRTKGAKFEMIDLQWGVPQEAAQAQRTVDVCIAEVARAAAPPRPSFLLFIGDRYGWEPLPSAIPADEFDAIESWLTQHRPAAAAQLLQWYEEEPDANNIPSSHPLKARQGKFLDDAVWRDGVETPLREALRAAVEGAGFDTTSETIRRRYFMSVTHREVSEALDRLLDDPHEHARAFVRTTRALPQPGESVNSAAAFVDVDRNGGGIRAPGGGVQRILDQVMAKRVLVTPYEAAFDSRTGALRIDDVDRLMSRVAEWLKGRIDAELERIDQSGSDAEVAAQQQFRNSRFPASVGGFVGRDEALSHISEYLTPSADPARPLCVVGDGGTGKSALLAKASLDAETRFGTAYTVNYRFAGASATANSLAEVLTDLISEEDRQQEGTLGDQFRHSLLRKDRDRPLALFLDGLDQFSDLGTDWLRGWLPEDLPPTVRIVVSVRSDTPAHQLLKGIVSDEVILGPLHANDAKRLLLNLLAQSGRTLQPHQVEAVLAAAAPERRPLYLVMAARGAERWRSQDIAPALPSDLESVCGAFLDELATSPEYPHAVVQRALGYIALAREGLSEQELLDLLARDRDAGIVSLPTEWPSTKEFPRIVAARLRHQLASFLTESDSDGSPLLQFFHLELRDAVVARLSKGDRQALHNALFEYFREQEDFVASRPNRRKAAEAVHHGLKTAQRCAVTECLLSLSFVQLKLETGRASELLAELSTVLNGDLDEPTRQELEEEQAFLRQHHHLFRRYPDMLLQQALSESVAESVKQRASNYRKTLARKAAVLLSMNAADGREPSTILLPPDRYTHASLASDGRRLAASNGYNVSVWDVDDELPRLAKFRPAAARYLTDGLSEYDGLTLSGNGNAVFLDRLRWDGLPHVLGKDRCDLEPSRHIEVVEILPQPAGARSRLSPVCVTAPSFSRARDVVAALTWKGDLWTAQIQEASVVTREIPWRSDLVVCEAPDPRLVLSPDGRLACARVRGRLHVMDLMTGHHWMAASDCASDPVFVPDESLILYGTAEGKLCKVECTEGSPATDVASIQTDLTGANLLASEQVVVIRDREYRVLIWDRSGLSEAQPIDVQSNAGDAVFQLVSDGRRLMVGGRMKAVQLVDLGTHDVLETRSHIDTGHYEVVAAASEEPIWVSRGGAQEMAPLAIWRGVEQGSGPGRTASEITFLDLRRVQGVWELLAASANGWIGAVNAATGETRTLFEPDSQRSMVAGIIEPAFALSWGELRRPVLIDLEAVRLGRRSEIPVATYEGVDEKQLTTGALTDRFVAPVYRKGVAVWERKRPHLWEPRFLAGVRSLVGARAMTADGRWVVTAEMSAPERPGGAEDEAVVLRWDLEADRHSVAFLCSVRGYCNFAAVSPAAARTYLFFDHTRESKAHVRVVEVTGGARRTLESPVGWALPTREHTIVLDGVSMATAFAVPMEESHALVGTEDGIVWIWSLASGELVARHAHPVRARPTKILSFEEGRFFVGYSDGSIHLLTLDAGS